MSNIKQLFAKYPKIESSNSIEEVLCLATLIGSAEIAPNSTLEDSKRFLEEVNGGDCNNCLLKRVCLACIINE